MPDRTITELDEAESLKLISPGGIGRIAYQSRFGPAVLPVNYKWHDGAIVFRTAQHSALDEDLQTGIAGGDYLVAFEIDEIDEVGRQGWSVLIQGPAHHVEGDRKSTRLNSSHQIISYAVFCLKKKQPRQCLALRKRPVLQRRGLGRHRCCKRRRALDEVVLFFNDTATTEIYALSLHDALPI